MYGYESNISSLFKEFFFAIINKKNTSNIRIFRLKFKKKYFCSEMYWLLVSKLYLRLVIFFSCSMFKCQQCKYVKMVSLIQLFLYFSSVKLSIYQCKIPVKLCSLVLVMVVKCLFVFFFLFLYIINVLCSIEKKYFKSFRYFLNLDL